jgi:hypothetical protein
LIPQFRSHLNRDPELEVDKEGQQQVLRPTFKKGGFYDRSGAKI